MQQQSAQRSALANRPITVRPCPPTSQRQFAGILNHDDVAPGDTCARARDRMAHHLANRHGAIVQKTPEPHLLRPTSGKSPDPTAGPLNQGSVERDPPFSRRRSPNRPSPNSIDMPPLRESTSIHGISLPDFRQ